MSKEGSFSYTFEKVECIFRYRYRKRRDDSCGPMPIAREQLKEIDECVRTKQRISASRWDWTYRLGTKGRSRQDTLVGQYRVSKAHLEHWNWNLLVQRPLTRKTGGRKRLRLNPEKKDWRQRPKTRDWQRPREGRDSLPSINPSLLPTAPLLDADSRF